jgi:hypothetical protein
METIRCDTALPKVVPDVDRLGCRAGQAGQIGRHLLVHPL